MSGAKLISTLAPVADELVVFPLPGYTAGDEAFTAAFAVPAATPGLRFVCRDSFGGAPRPVRDHPLGRYDEMDAICIFDDVLVPADRVFFCGEVGLANRLYDAKPVAAKLADALASRLADGVGEPPATTASISSSSTSPRKRLNPTGPMRRAPSGATLAAMQFNQPRSPGAFSSLQASLKQRSPQSARWQKQVIINRRCR